MIINELYDTLRLYKNFFQPVMKLKEKIREKGKIHWRYGRAMTPYQRIIESNWISDKKRRELTEIYLSLNPAKLKRYIDNLTTRLYEEYQSKRKLKVEVHKKLHPIYGQVFYEPKKLVSVT